MEDWKDALSALTGFVAEDATEEMASETVVSKKKRNGVVYSTNPSYEYADCSEVDEVETLAPSAQKLRVNMERAGRAGKTVTLVRGFIGTPNDISALCKQLKQKCGVGGSVKDGVIIVQGDHRAKVVDVLKATGYSQTK